tara:strand:+ start:2171 stop:2842 length:672 start_codon:yes stop_codon:yes gene_type:complete
MSLYGIRVTGVNDSYQIDSSSTSTANNTPKFLAVHDSNDNHSAGVAVSNYSAGDILFARPTSGTAVVCATQSTLDGNITFNTAVKYRLLKPANSASLSTTGSYGVQVFNSASTPVLIYDSRHTSKGVEIKQVWTKNTFVGGLQPGAGTTNNTVYTASSQADFDSTFINVNAGFIGTNLAINSFYFNDSTNKILYNSHVTINFMGIGTVAIPNFTEILVGGVIE